MERTIEEKLEVMKAYLEGKTIQFKNRKKEDDDSWENANPTWDWDLFDYRIKPEESDEPKKLMSYRQLAELMAKGYGQNAYLYTDGTLSIVDDSFEYQRDREDDSVHEDRKIRAWGSKEWIEPTVDVYEEYVSKWNRAFKELEIKVVLSKKENTTSEESSSTEEESVGVHKRTPQEIADFFDCYVAMDWNGAWYLYEYEPMLSYSAKKWFCKRGECTAFGSDANSSAFLFIEISETCNWRTLYRPHKEPLVMEEDDD